MATPRFRRIPGASSHPSPCPPSPARRRTADEGLLNRPAPPRFRAKVPELGAFTHTDPWRVLRIQGEFVHGINALAEVGAAITVFGSARFQPDHPDALAATELAGKLVEAGFAVITGGGPGIMEAANRGPPRPAASRSAATSSCRSSSREPVRQPVDQLPLLLRPEDDVREVLQRVRHLPRRVRHPRRAVRGAHPGPDPQDQPVPDRPLRSRYWRGLLDWIKGTQLAAGDDLARGPEPPDRLPTRSDEVRDIMVDCYNTKCWNTWKKSEGAKLDADPPGEPATAPDRAKADGE